MNTNNYFLHLKNAVHGIHLQAIHSWNAPYAIYDIIFQENLRKNQKLIMYLFLTTGNLQFYKHGESIIPTTDAQGLKCLYCQVTT